MDFIKSCTTNLQRLENLHSIPYVVNVQTKAPDGVLTDHHTALATLREANVLCCVLDDKLYTFNTLSQPAALGDYHVEEQGTIQEQPGAEEPAPIVESFKRAVEEGVSFSLARQGDTYRIGTSKWLRLTKEDSYEEKACMISLNVQSVASGTLQFIADSQTTAMQSVTLVDGAQTVVLSPSGICANVLMNGAAVTGQQYEKRAPDLTWSAAVAQALRPEGIIINSHDQWLQVRLQDHPEIEFLWPQRLSFAMSSAPVPPIIPGQSDEQDPLSFAQQWAENAEERQRALHNSQEEANQSEDVVMQDDLDFGPSPPFSYRPELSNIGGVYPTPPDGMVPHTAQASLHHESSLQIHPELANEGSELFRMQTNDTGMLETRGRGPSITSSIGDFRQPVTDDLFGETDAVFGGGEVQENDFDFFDEQDDAGPGRHPQDTVVTTSVDLSDHAPSIMPMSEDPVDNAVAVETPVQLRDKDDLLVAGKSQEHTAQSIDLVEESPVISTDKTLHKTLSPFDIRERLLPPPVPASVANQQLSTIRRQSSFAPLVFHPDLQLDNRLQSYLLRNEVAARTRYSPASGKIAKPPESTPGHTRVPVQSSDDSDSDTPGSSLDVHNHRQPAYPPWQDLKRKRTSSVNDSLSATWHFTQDLDKTTMSTHNNDSMLEIVLNSVPINTNAQSVDQAEYRESQAVHLTLEKCFDNRPGGMVMIAQLVSEQAMTCTTDIANDLETVQPQPKGGTSRTARLALGSALSELLPSSRVLDLTTIASSKDIPRSNLPGKNQPRPPPRHETPGVELYPISAPYLRLQRADATMEMLPPAIHFWEALSLGPVHGSKNICMIFIFPESSSLSHRLSSFSDDLKTVYESCKLGAVGDDTSGPISEWPVQVNEDQNVFEQYMSYLQTCKSAASHLANHSSADPAQSYVIMLVPPYNSDVRFTRWLCACFWLMYKDYRDTVVGAAKSGSQKRFADLCLQILPAALFWSPDVLPMVNSSQLATLAREIYDRCPPDKTASSAADLAIRSSPSILLVETLPKRINFQLTPNAPTDLLHEGSELHVAYAKSSDGLWLTACWCDNTGGNQQTTAFCLRGTSLAATFAEIWSRTVAIIKNRPVSWRIGLLVVGSIDSVQVQCWREIIASQHPSRGGLHASLVVIHPSPSLKVGALPQTDSTTATAGGVITPVSTPQASSFTSSPDATGPTAPPTPAPTELSAENDPDARLVDLPDETWGVLIDSKLKLDSVISLPDVTTVAEGILVKHGQGENTDLPVLGVGIIFTLRVRSNNVSVEDAMAKYSEHILKELLCAYRGLSLLAKVRGVQHLPVEVDMPLHAVAAVKAADALSGLLENE